MFLKTYNREIKMPECNHTSEKLVCIVHLDEDISKVLPCLNAILGGYDFQKIRLP